MRIGRGSRATLDPIGEISMGEELPPCPRMAARTGSVSREGAPSVQQATPMRDAYLSDAHDRC